MKFLLGLLLLFPAITASDGHKSEESHEDTKGAKDLKKALRETVSGNTEFALSFYRHLTSASSQAKDSSSKNVVFSPISISSAFSMLSLGARSKTHQEIWEGLRLNDTHCRVKEVHRAYSDLLQALNEPKSSLRVNIGNAVFVADTLTLLKRFENDLQQFYHAEIKNTNFIDSQKAEKQINAYVKNKTEGKIEELVKGLSGRTQMVLVNYVLFQGEWQNIFNPDGTRLGKFFLDNNTTVDVPMMNRVGSYHIYQDQHLPCTVIELPYKDNASMIIAVAKPGKIHEVEQGLSVETIQRWKSSFNYRFTDLYLPKFSISSTMDLKAALSPLGIATAFTDAADFSGITGNLGLKVGKAVHKAVLNVDENGTVAAAATFVEMVPDALFPEMRVDHPFLITITDHNTNSILFMATVMNPTEK